MLFFIMVRVFGEPWNNNNALVTRDLLILVQKNLNSFAHKSEKDQRESQLVGCKKLKGSKALSSTLVFKIL